MSLVACYPHRRRSARLPARWVFAWLVLGWFCANQPQVALGTLTRWWGGVAHFQHHDHLVAEVLALQRTAACAPAETTVAAAAQPSPQAARPLPPEPAIKRLELAAADEAVAVAAPDAPDVPEAELQLLPESIVHDVPHPPPRGRWLS